MNKRPLRPKFRSTTFAATLAGAVWLLIPVAMNASEADTHMERAVQYEFQGNIQAAEAEYRRVIELEPNSADAHSKLGMLLLAHDGAIDAAISEFVTALGIDPSCCDCQTHLDEAVAARNMTSTQALNRGNEYYRNNDFSRAIGMYRVAIYADPGSAEAHNSLAWTLYRLGQLDEASSEVKEALRLKPGDPEYINTLACVLYDQGKLDAAIAEWQRAISKSKTPNPADLYGLALGFLSKGEKDRAADNYKQALKMDPKYSDVSYLRDKIGMSIHALAAHDQLVSLAGEKQK